MWKASEWTHIDRPVDSVKGQSEEVLLIMLLIHRPMAAHNKCMAERADQMHGGWLGATSGRLWQPKMVSKGLETKLAVAVMPFVCAKSIKTNTINSRGESESSNGGMLCPDIASFLMDQVSRFRLWNPRQASMETS
jgi:hypothetical protein